MSVFSRLFPNYRLLLAIMLLPMLNACSSRPTLPGQEEQFEKLQQAMQSGAYRPAGNFELDSVRDRWLHDGVELDVEMLAPKAAGSYPLVIYLPVSAKTQGPAGCGGKAGPRPVMPYSASSRWKSLRP